MIEKRQPPRNGLLARLSREELGLFCGDLQRAELIVGDRIAGPDAPLSGVWFPESGIVSVLVRDARGVESEVAMVGREAAVGTFHLDAIHSTPLRGVVQQRGVAHFLAADRIAVAVERVPRMRGILFEALGSLLRGATLTAHANARGRVIERVARWLLMAHDRIDSDVVFVTHDVLAAMLGVRRVGVTNALHVLEGERFIRAYRGRIRILDRPGLMRGTKDLYGAGGAVPDPSVILGDGVGSFAGAQEMIA